MRKLPFIAVLAFLLASPLWAQRSYETSYSGRTCATVENDMELREKYPKLGSKEDFEDWLGLQIDEYRAFGTEAVTTIPVVFHIIHNGDAVGSGDNIGQAYIDAQLDQLNNDFRRISGTSGDNSHPNGADTEVQYAYYTGTGGGINRINRNSQGWSAPPYARSYFESTIKPNTVVDGVLNIWCATLSGGLLGYAQFPSQSGLGGLDNDEGPAETDGVVILTSSMGSTSTPNPNGGNFAAGRTLTHEIGHWLGLRHIWGDGGCSVDDYVSDTPTSDAANYGCPTGHNSCSSTDMIENYMDYTNDTCMNIFTNGQKTRIQAVLANALRRQFSTDPGPGPGDECTSTIASFPYNESFESGLGAWSQASGDDLDWARTNASTPSSNTGPTAANDGSYYLFVEASSPNYPSKTTILNGPCFDLSNRDVANFKFDYHMWGSAMGSLYLEASTDQGANWTVVTSFSGDQGNSWATEEVSLGAYLNNTVQLRFRGVTGSSYTSDISIDNLSLNVTSDPGPGNGCTGGIASFPYTEGFESGLGDWSQASGDDFDWSRNSGGTPSNNTGPSSAAQGSWYMYTESSSPNYSNKTATFNGPCFDLSNESSATFAFRYHMYGSSAMGRLTLEASEDGSTWNSVWTISGNQGNSWGSASVDLGAYAGGSVTLRFVGLTGTTWQGDMAIDDLSLSTDGGTPPGDKTLTLTLTFDNYPEETSWQLQSGASVVASGGTYGNQADGSTINVPITVAAGNYTFVISDSYGDGMCCNYGNGSYSLRDESNNVLASGGSFGSSDSTNITVQ